MRIDSGFTLLELMILIAIIGIMSAIAVPSTLQWRENSQLRSAVQSVYSDFQRAKLEAAKRNTDCAVLFNGTGYTVIVETVNENLAQDGGEPVISTVRWSEYGSVNEVANTFIADPIAYGDNGLLADGSGAGGTLTLQNRGGNQASVNMSATGVIWITP